MITEPTVLVLGAGASSPYGYPLGKDLYYEVVRGLHHYGSPIERFLSKIYREDPVRKFGAALRRSPSEAVDAFLEHNDQFLDVGRSAIACAIAQHEIEDNVFPDSVTDTQGHWYRFLFDCLGPSFDRFGDNKLSLITFNYDRSIEHFMFTAMKNFYNRPEEECISQLTELPIIHVHGSLVPLPWQSPDGVPFGKLGDGTHISESAAYIRIIHQVSAEDPQFGRARELLSKARHVYFMGFGYLPDNLRKLGLHGVPEGAQLRGTAWGMSESLKDRKRANINGALGDQAARVRVELHVCDCLNFLTNYRDVRLK